MPGAGNVVLVLEASTTSAKCLILDSGTGVVEVRTRRFSDESPARDGDVITAELLALGRETAAGRPVDVIALSSTWHGMTLRTPDLHAVTPVYEWPHTGAHEVASRWRSDPEFVEWFRRRTGCLVNASYPAFKLAQLVRDGVDLRGLLMLDQGGLVFARLTGRTWTSLSTASGTGLISVETGEWDAEVRQRLGIGAVLLPELKPSSAWAPLQPEAAALLGQRAGTPVLVPGPDGGLNQIGDRASGIGDMTFSMGTSGALRMTAALPSFAADTGTWTYRSPAGWLSGAATSGCGNCVDWARRRLFPDVDYAALEALLDPARSDLPLFLPFLFGERSPGWDDRRRGGFLEVEPHHSAIDLYQAVLHGIVYSLHHCFTELVSLNGQPKRIVISGGVLSSGYWSQLAADVFGMPLEVSDLQHTSLVGAARLALEHAGEDADHPALRASAPRMLVPDPQRTAILDVQRERYLDGYARTRPADRLAVPTPT
ncbi:FGGY-family carbohydrate kinase [Microbacterium esteraromaticum]|uniref:FGGY-family carbohydrate kinase n=1 Tax=Microbacterium esteraromaticum TaxID=57043 RepID=A0A7D8A8A7_9MICO|nr:FGGY-family carbohydrate kinase [Microbacterium esteraromaticum]QMU95861.1 FGGY-family carbohydrate kinase [Microbacterium esteraromaticum]